MRKKVSVQTQNNKIKNTKSFCKHNQKQNKTNFLINLDKIGLILSLFQVLLSLVFTLFVVYLSGYKNLSRYAFYTGGGTGIVLIVWVFIVITALFIIKSACKIKLIKNHEPTKLNCQKIEQNTQQAIKSFKENLEIAIYLWFFIICTLVFANLLVFFSNSSPKQMIFKLLTPIIVFCYFFIGLSCILFIRKQKK